MNFEIGKMCQQPNERRAAECRALQALHSITGGKKDTILPARAKLAAPFLVDPHATRLRTPRQGAFAGMNANGCVATKLPAVSPEKTWPASMVSFITGAPGFRLSFFSDTQNVSGRVAESK